MYRIGDARSALAFAVALAALSFTASRAYAQNPRETLLGGRTATMGGAGTAAGNDSAMPYLNPAGLAALPTDVLAVSGSIYAYTRRSYEQGFFTPNGVAPVLGRYTMDQSVSSNDVIELPSSVMYVRHFASADSNLSHVVGMALIIPRAKRETVQANLDGNFSGVGGNIRIRRAVASEATYYHFGPSYAVDVDNDLRLGLSAHVVYASRKRVEQLSHSMGLFGGAIPFTGKSLQSAKTDVLAFVPTLGVQAQLSPRLYVGAAVVAPSTQIWGRMKASSENAGTGANASNGLPIVYQDTYTYEGVREERLPWRLNAGFAWEDIGSYAVAGDLVYFAKQEDQSTSDLLIHASRMRTGETEREFDVHHRSSTDTAGVLDVSLGLEFNVRSNMTLRIGGFTDLSDMSELDADHADNYAGRTRIDRYGGTFGLGFAMGAFDSTVGLYYVRGIGQTTVADAMSDPMGPDRLGSVDVTTDTVGLILSSAVSTSEAKKTIESTLPMGGME